MSASHVLPPWTNVLTSSFHGWLFHACNLRFILNQAANIIRYVIRSQLNKFDSTPILGSALNDGVSEKNFSGPLDITTLRQVRKKVRRFLHSLCRYVAGAGCRNHHRQQSSAYSIARRQQLTSSLVSHL